MFYVYIYTNEEDIEFYKNVTVIYGVTGIKKFGKLQIWYDLYRKKKKTVIGHVTDVEKIKEKW